VPITRRELFAGAAAGVPLLAQRRPATPQPNIVLILAEDIAAFMLGCYGNKEIRTPNIDQLAAGGVKFHNTYACAPVAATSRATLLTGRTPMQPEQGTAGTLADVLAGQGFRCGAGEDGRFLDEQQPGKPFFLTVSHKAADPPRKYTELYANTKFDSIGWEPPRDKSMAQDVAGNIRKRAAALTALDDQVPPLLKKLEARGLRDNTLIIFVSTNGVLLGRHGLWGNGLASDPPNMFEEVVNVPMMWNWPGRTPVESSRSEMVGLYDVLPTVCEIAGAPVPQHLCGRSFLRLVEGRLPSKKERWPATQVFGHFQNTEMVRDNRFKLVLRNDGKGPNELYDDRADPRERVNQYENRQFVTVRDQMTKDLAGWKAKYSS
jgi:arylsulfatase A-like enzyme